jgi:hypothetical protein
MTVPSRTQQQVTAAIRALGHARTQTVSQVTHDGPNDGIGPRLTLAIAVRETNARNIVGDHGHGRGIVQIDDRFWTLWLKFHEGCHDGSWTPTFLLSQQGAAPAGRVPTLPAAIGHLVAMLRDNLRYAAARGVDQQESLRFAVAAYNAGPGLAFKGWKAGDVDAFTAGGNYSADVFALMDLVDVALTQLAFTRLGWTI